MKAIWNNQIIAESDETIEIEGNQYFPPSSINDKYFLKSNTKTHCPWKGDASYKSLDVEGNKNEDAAWFYPEPKKAAEEIKGYIAFWKGVKVVK